MRLRPLGERLKVPSNTAKIQNLQSDDKVNLSPAHKLVYVAIRQKHGEAQARAWLETEHQKGRLRGDFELCRASELLEPEKTDLEEPLTPAQERLRSPETAFLAKWRGKITPPALPKPVKRLSEHDPCKLAGERMKRLEHRLPPKARLLYRVLLEIAFIVAQRRGYAEGVTRVTFHCPQDIIAFALGIHRTTIWRNLEPLTELGLVACEGHITTVSNSPTAKSNNITDGKLWCIKLDPKGEEPARLSFEDFKTQWRDLEGDIESGRTAYNFVQNAKAEAVENSTCPEQSRRMQQSNTEDITKLAVELIKDWALPPSSIKPPLDIQKMTVASDLETILDLPGTPKDQRNEMVDVAATSITYALGDIHSPLSLKFYRRLCWNLLRRYDQGQDYFMTVYEMILRARADYQEGFARKAGALLHSRLKAWPVWEHLERTPPTRVGTPPIRA